MEYLTCEEVAELAHCSVFHIRRSVSAGELPAYKPARSLLFKRAEVDAWISASAIRKAAKAKSETQPNERSRA